MRKVQFIIIEDELKSPRSLSFSKKKLKLTLFLTAFTFLALTIFSIFGFRNYMRARSLSKELQAFKVENNQLKMRVASLEREKRESVSEIAKRIEIIDSIMKKVGLKKAISGDKFSGEGGIYIPLDEVDKVDLDSIAESADEFIRKLRTTPLSYPVYGRITSEFGIRRDPFTHRLAFHPGIDIANRTGVPVRATADGVVERAGWWGSWGKVVVIRHTRELKTLYAHLDKVYVRKGQKVYRGEIIGTLGNTGRSTGPHLHYGIMYKGKWINPLKFMEVRVDREKGEG